MTDLQRLNQNLLHYLAGCSVEELQVICYRLALELDARGLPDVDHLLDAATNLGQWLRARMRAHAARPGA